MTSGLIIGLRTLALLPAVVLTPVASWDATAATFSVDAVVDETDLVPGDGACLSASGACTLRAAIQEANALPGRDVVVLPAGTYRLDLVGLDEDTAATGDLDISDDLDLTGAGPETTVIESGSSGDRIFHCLGGTDVTISALTASRGGRVPLRDALRGGGLLVDGSSVTLQDIRLWSNNADRGGGAAFVSSGSLTLQACSVRFNDSGIFPAASIWLLDGVLNVRDSTIEAGGLQPDGSIVITDGVSEITRSMLVGGGPAVKIEAGSLTISDSTMTLGQMLHLPGGISVAGGATVSVTRSSISDGYGTGIAVMGGTVVVTESTVSGWQADSGGGVAVIGGSLTMTNCTVSDNTSGGEGGGGLRVTAGSVALNNVTVIANAAGTWPDVPGDGAGVYVEGGVLTLANTILAENVNVASWAQADCFGLVESLGHNLFESAEDCTIVGDQTGNVIGMDARLGPLEDNGGPTRTHALLRGSPAIDGGSPDIPGGGAGACEATDQRGVVRPVGTACDVGAFESPDCPEPSALDVDPLAMPLTVTLSAPGVISLAWGAVSASEFNVYRGSLEQLAAVAYDHEAIECGLPAGPALVEIIPSSTYFIVAAGCGRLESSHGRDSRGVERDSGGVGCR